jgi:hypothetical protein
MIIEHICISQTGKADPGWPNLIYTSLLLEQIHVLRRGLTHAAITMRCVLSNGGAISTLPHPGIVMIAVGDDLFCLDGNPSMDYRRRFQYARHV